MEQDTHLDQVRAALAPEYRIERQLGRGAFATVYLASDLRHERQVAIKVLKPELSQAIARQRFLREIRVTGHLHHPNILEVLDSGERDDILYYVMPYVEGRTLRHRMQSERQLPVDEALRITREVAAGLAAAHADGVLHRDVKPENILFQNGSAMVADFGIAKAFTEAGVDTLSSTGLGIGTPGYMSPEQASGEHSLDQRTDIYSLACVTYEMLGGEPPYTGPTAQALLAKKLNLPVPSVRILRETIPRSIDAVLKRALAKAPADRPATMDQFIEQLSTAAAAPPEATPTPLASAIALASRHPIKSAIAGVVTVLLAGWVAWPAAPLGTGVVVIARHSPASSAQELQLAASLAEAMTLELNRWQSVRAVPAVSLEGPMFDLGLQGPALSIEDGLRVAREVSVRTMVSVMVRVRGDSAQATAIMVDVRRGAEDQPKLSTAPVNDVEALAQPLVADILGLDSTGPNPAQLRRLSAFPDAIMADRDGLRHLERGRLPEAEQAFRRAIRVDTGFALARHHLAETLYWQAFLEPGREGKLVPEIARLSTAAAAQAGELRPRDSLDVVAFNALTAGDYEAARAAYRSILAADPTDVHALLMRGNVESRDPWLIRKGNGALTPRGNLNIAWRDVAEIVRLQPTFDLGYSNLSAVLQDVDNPAERRMCRGFEMPRNQVRLPSDPSSPEQQRGFCAVFRDDSIVWVSKEAFDALDPEQVSAGARQAFEQYLALVRRWATYAGSELRPREEMVSALLAQRRRLGVTAPERHAALADSALRFAESALALKADTTADDLVRLGNLRLGVGDYEGAVRLTQQAMRVSPATAGAPPARLRTLAANPFMAVGQVLRAMEIASGSQAERFLLDSVAGGLVPFGGAEPVLKRIEVLGATGAGGELLRREFAELQRLWSDSRYSERQRAMLRDRVAMELASALVLDSTLLESWSREVRQPKPLWRALVEDPARAREDLTASMADGADQLGEALRSFLHGVVAARLGDHQLAVARFTRLDSLPLRLDGMQSAWGLLGLSRLRRAQSYETLGDTLNARRWYREFVRLRASADPAGRLLVEEANRALSRLAKQS